MNKKIVFAVTLTVSVCVAASIIVLFTALRALPDFDVMVLEIERVAALRYEWYRYNVHLTIRNNGSADATGVEGYVQFWSEAPVSAGLIGFPEGEDEIVSNEEINQAVHLLGPDLKEVKYLIIRVSCAEGVSKEFYVTKP